MVTIKKTTKPIIKPHAPGRATHGVKKVALQLFGGLLMEHKHNEWTISLGRIAFWAVFIHCLKVWGQSAIQSGSMLVAPDVSQGELKVLGMLLLYNLTKHGLEGFKSVASIWRGMDGMQGTGGSETVISNISVDRT
jgi:hypothetical protein